MRHATIRGMLLFLVVVLLGSLTLACSKEPEQSSITSTKPAGGTGTSTTAPPGATGTATSTPGTSATGPAGAPDIADMKSLASYRLSIMNKIVSGTGAGTVSYIKYEWVRDQQAEHAWMEDGSGQAQELYIRIGDKQWMYLPGMGWMEQPPQTAQPPDAPSDIAEQMEQASESRFEKKGNETVNNVKCIKYEFEYETTVETPGMGIGGTIKTDIHSSGNIWVADQGDLPAVMIKSVGTSEVTSAGQTTVMETEQNLTDIGANITISPPEGATQIPTLPTLPTGLPTSPTTPTTPSSTTTTPTTTTPTTTTTTTVTTSPGGEVSTFEEDFQDALKSDWAWIDPKHDASYSLTARPGYLQIIASDDNDLTNYTNYDAPRLLVQKNGDFTMETLLEFDPQVDYQGAGLLVWQEERAFLRLEFGFGGLGGGAKNVALLRQERYNLDLVSSFDLPGIFTRIELRLKRQGSKFTAWYRQPGLAWVEMGSTELALNSVVGVGIININQNTTWEVPAEFDYFKVY